MATEAALNNLKNDEDGLNTKIKLAVKELPNMMDKGMAIAMRERLSYLKLLTHADAK